MERAVGPAMPLPSQVILVGNEFRQQDRITTNNPGKSNEAHRI